MFNGKKLVEGTEAIKVAKEYYQDLYSDEPIPKKKINNFLKNTGVKLNQKEKKFLDKPFTIEEIKDAIKYTNRDKTPGPTGLKITFYKKQIDQIAPILTEIANKMMEEGKINEKINRSNITLIPKKKQRSN